MSPYCNSYDVLIFDIGGVLFTPTGGGTIQVGPNMLKRIIGTEAWYDFEMGRLTDDDAFALIAPQFGVSKDDIREAVQHAMESLVCNTAMFNLVNGLKLGRKVYAMSNMPLSAWEIVKGQGGTLWDVFDDIFLSGTVGERKHDTPFYQHVLRSTGALPQRTLFVDDTADNIVTGRFLGMKCILFDNFANVQQALLNLCGDPVLRADQFLATNAKRHHSYVSPSSHIFPENVSQLLILEATNDSPLVDYAEYAAECNFFTGTAQFTTTALPEDLDATSLYWTIIPDIASHDTKMKVMDRMLEFCNVDGIPLTYFDHNRQRRDHVVCVNVLALFHAYGRGDELSRAAEFIDTILRTRAYIGGARYYEGPETFFYFLLRLLERAPSLEKLMGPLFKERCQERVGTSCDALSLAMRLHCCTRLGLKAETDFYALLEMQQPDGGWDGGQIYHFSSGLPIGNRGVATSIAVQAIREFLSKFD